jgi:hypothetical protein
VKKLLDAVFDTTVLQSGPVQPMSELQPINDWNLAVLKVGLVYILAGTGVTDVAAIPDDEKVANKINQNTVEYAPEMGRYLDAQLHIQEALMGTVGEFLATAPEADKDKPNVKEGVADIKSGIARTMHGVITTLPIEGLSDDWRRERLTVLVGMAPKAVKFLVPEDLKALHDSALEVAGTISAPQIKAQLEALAKALQPTA